MIQKFLNKFKSLLLPSETVPEPIVKNTSTGFIAPRQRVLDRLKEHFLTEMANETTTESLLYHTSFTVYISESEYDRLSPSFAQTVRDAINVFVRELRKVIKKYPGYQNHSNYWEMQLVAIPENAEIDGITADILKENPTIIKSKLFADNEYDPRMQSDNERCVTTIHTKDSSKQMPNAFNLAALKGLTELAKDKYRVEFNLSDTLSEVPLSEAERTTSRTSYYAFLQIADGTFVNSKGQKFKGYRMTENKLLVSGKSGSSNRQIDEIQIDDDNVLNPTLEINRDKTTGNFSVRAYGDVKINGKRVESGDEVMLPNNSGIMINGDYQLDFKIK